MRYGHCHGIQGVLSMAGARDMGTLQEGSGRPLETHFCEASTAFDIKVSTLVVLMFTKEYLCYF